MTHKHPRHASHPAGVQRKAPWFLFFWQNVTFQGAKGDSAVCCVSEGQRGLLGGHRSTLQLS